MAQLKYERPEITDFDSGPNITIAVTKRNIGVK
jgi:hypothetical protein